MLRVSRLADYATSLMACLGSQPDDVLSAAQLAECLRLEVPTVSKLLKLLTRAGLLESFRGANGGYRLAVPASQITVAEVVEAVEGPIHLTECSTAIGACEREADCRVRQGWQGINASIAGALRQVSVADILQQSRVTSEI